MQSKTCTPIHTRWCYGGCGTTAWQQLPKWNKLSSSNLWLQYGDKSHKSDIPHFSDYILHSCQARLCGVWAYIEVSYSSDAHSPFNSLHLITDDKALVCSCTEAYSRNRSMLTCPLAIFNSVNMKLRFQGSPRTPSDTGRTVQVTWNMLAPVYRSY